MISCCFIQVLLCGWLKEGLSQAFSLLRKIASSLFAHFRRSLPAALLLDHLLHCYVLTYFAFLCSRLFRSLFNNYCLCSSSPLFNNGCSLAKQTHLLAKGTFYSWTTCRTGSLLMLADRPRFGLRQPKEPGNFAYSLIVANCSSIARYFEINHLEASQPGVC